MKSLTLAITREAGEKIVATKRTIMIFQMTNTPTFSVLGNHMVMSMNKQDLKEKLIVGGMMAAVFLPVRVLFYTYVSQYWLGSFGLVSAIALVMFALTKKNKLGWFGIMFQKQMSKITRGKIGTTALVITIFSILYFGGSILLIQKGITLYADDKTQIESMMKDGSTPYIITGHENNLDFVPATVFAIMNDMTNGWILHFHTVIFVGELEALAVLIFYRKVYRKVLE